MPTQLPTRPTDDRRLSLPDSARFLFLVARVRLLDARLHVLVAWGWGLGDDRLLRLMRRWLSYHDAIGALLPGIPEPQHVKEVRAILRPVTKSNAAEGTAR